MLAKRKNKRTLFIVLMLAFPLAQFLVFWVYVNYSSIVMAFQNFEGFNSTGFTFSNFAKFFKDISAPESNLRNSVFNSLWLFPVSNFIALPLTILFSFILYKKVMFHKFFRLVFFLPSVLSSVIMVSVFKNTIAVGGPVDALLKTFGMTDIPIWLADERTAFGIILFFTVWCGLGFNIVLLSAAIGRVPQDIFEYDRLEGVGLFRELFQVVVPLVWSTITTLFVIGTSGVFVTVGPVLLMTNGQYNTGTIAFFIFNEVKYAGSYNYPSAVGLIFTLVAMPLVLGVKKLLEKIGDNVEF